MAVMSEAIKYTHTHTSCFNVPLAAGEEQYPLHSPIILHRHGSLHFFFFCFLCTLLYMSTKHKPHLIIHPSFGGINESMMSAHHLFCVMVVVSVVVGSVGALDIVNDEVPDHHVLSNEQLFGCFQDDVRRLVGAAMPPFVGERTVSSAVPESLLEEDVLLSWKVWMHAVGSQLFLFGEGPLDLYSCSNPFATFNALSNCASEGHDDTAGDNGGAYEEEGSTLEVLTSLCSEPRDLWMRRVMRCLQGFHGSDHLLMSTRNGVVHQQFCRYVSTCTLEGLDRLCTIVVSAAERKRRFCVEMRHASIVKLERSCQSRWPMVRRSMWRAFTEALHKDATTRATTRGATASGDLDFSDLCQGFFESPRSGHNLSDDDQHAGMADLCTQALRLFKTASDNALAPFVFPELLNALNVTNHQQFVAY